MRLNTKPAFAEITHEGAQAARINDSQGLRRSVLSTLLWERQFYEDGEEIAGRIVRLAKLVPAAELAALAIEAREHFHLRHVPLLLLSVLAETGSGSGLVGRTIARVIQRVDELAEFLVVHAERHGKAPRVTPSQLKPILSAQMRKGLAQAFLKFDEYQLAKYDRAGLVELRDVLVLCHAKPEGAAREAMWKRLLQGELKTPDTWEVELSAGADKKATFERLIGERKLGYFALLRNLRNMMEAGCDEVLVRQAIMERRGGAERVLPFRYIAAARAVPQLERSIDAALIAAIGASPLLTGRTVVLVDVSGSMESKMSSKGDLTRMDAAAALAAIIRCEDLRVFAFSDTIVEVPARVGMAGIDAIESSMPHQGTRLFEAVTQINALVEYDRLIVVTDEQARMSHIMGAPHALPAPKTRGYLINVASNQNGVGYGPWVHIDGFSEAVLRFIGEHEMESAG